MSGLLCSGVIGCLPVAVLRVKASAGWVLICCLLGICLSLHSTYFAREGRLSLSSCFVLAQPSLQWLVTQWAKAQGEYLLLME